MQDENRNFRQFKTDWALALMTKGVIVKLSIRRWRATASLTFEDLGIKFIDDESSKFARKYLRLGIQKLLPPEISKEMTSLELMARAVLKKHSFPTVWGRFVPLTSFDNWENENQIVHDDFMQAATVLGNRYDEIISKVKEDYKNLARDVWARLYSDDTSPTEAFIENFVSKVIDKIPTREDVVGSFKYDTTCFFIPMPSFVQKNIAEADKIKRDSEMEDFKTEMEKQTIERIRNQYIKRKEELIDNFLESTVVSMRKHVADLCDSILRSIGKQSATKGVTLNHINKIQKVIDDVEMLNFYNDDEISALLKDLEEEINKFKGERNKDVVVDRLKKIVEIGGKEFIPKNFNPATDYLRL